MSYGVQCCENLKRFKQKTCNISENSQKTNERLFKKIW